MEKIRNIVFGMAAILVAVSIFLATRSKSKIDRAAILEKAREAKKEKSILKSMDNLNDDSMQTEKENE